MTSDDFIFTPLIALGTALGATGGGAAAGTVGGIAALSAASTAASIGTSVAGSMKKTPDAGPQTPQPSMAQAEQAKAEVRTRSAARQGYKSTLLTNQLQQYQSGIGKVKLGQ